MIATDKLDGITARWLGLAAELLAAHYFAMEGYVVGVTLIPTSYDLIVDTHKALYRVQVKQAHLRKQRQRLKGKGDRPCYHVDLKPYNNFDKRIAADRFDFLCVLCSKSDVYVIPARQLIAEDDPTGFVRNVRIKPAHDNLTRADSLDAAERWEPYRNQFRLEQV